MAGKRLKSNMTLVVGALSQPLWRPRWQMWTSKLIEERGARWWDGRVLVSRYLLAIVTLTAERLEPTINKAVSADLPLAQAVVASLGSIFQTTVGQALRSPGLTLCAAYGYLPRLPFLDGFESLSSKGVVDSAPEFGFDVLTRQAQAQRIQPKTWSRSWVIEPICQRLVNVLNTHVFKVSFLGSGCWDKVRGELDVCRDYGREFGAGAFRERIMTGSTIVPIEIQFSYRIRIIHFRGRLVAGTQVGREDEERKNVEVIVKQVLAALEEDMVSDAWVWTEAPFR
ncbi:hypothetical protein B0H10DRAFT_1948838 [Mycena sp. CBHHK59/15]|nr:hypothetical protein B0H10DRAFT_1948838 [Mycena sp. CBHHK59/15]